MDMEKNSYVSEPVMRMAVSIARPNLISLGTCLGKFSKTGKFRLHITALEWLGKYAKYKVRALSLSLLFTISDLYIP
jgi:ribosome biogenesis protein Nip4